MKIKLWDETYEFGATELGTPIEAELEYFRCNDGATKVVGLTMVPMDNDEWGESLYLFWRTDKYGVEVAMRKRFEFMTQLQKGEATVDFDDIYDIWDSNLEGIDYDGGDYFHAREVHRVNEELENLRQAVLRRRLTLKAYGEKKQELEGWLDMVRCM